MRELKFRVWGKTEKEYIRYPFAWLSIFDSPDGLEIEDNENLVIEQYTGLKDKNGKEIYEGDILQIDDHILGDFKVVWHNLGWGIKRSVGYETLAVHKSENCTVIGNIHENPEAVEEHE